MSFGDINWLAWLVGAAFSMVLGFLWYGPFFGKPWMAIMERAGKKREDMKGSAGMYVVTLISALGASYVLALIVRSLGINTWYDGLVAGAVVWVGIGATALLTNAIFEDKPKSLWLIFATYQLVVSSAQGVLFALWR